MVGNDKLRDSVARELLSVIALPGTPDIIAIDCELKKKYRSPIRPWPYASAEDACQCFEKVAAEGQKKYAGIEVTVVKESILRLEKVDRKAIL